MQGVHAEDDAFGTEELLLVDGGVGEFETHRVEVVLTRLTLHLR